MTEPQWQRTSHSAARAFALRGERDRALRSTARGARPETASHVAIVGTILGVRLTNPAASRAVEAGLLRVRRPCDGSNELAHLHTCRCAGGGVRLFPNGSERLRPGGRG